MRIATSPRRVLVTAPLAEHQRFDELFRQRPLAQWETVYSEDVDEARFFMQYSSVDVWLIHHAAATNTNTIAQVDLPTFYLCELDADSIVPAFQVGLTSWLPVSMVWDHPALLASGLLSALRLRRRQQRSEIVERKWRRCRRRMDRLVHVIWRTTPVASPQEWFPQRFAMERLQEEVARANRFDEPLSVAIGEIRVDSSHQQAPVADWMPNVLGRMKRRCDVIGQYGMNGFLLVMVHTPKSGAITCCQRLRAALEKDRCHAFFGVAEAEKECTPQQLLRQAEENLDIAVRGDDVTSNIADRK